MPVAGTEAGATVAIRDLVKRYPLFNRRRDRMLAFAGMTGSLTFKTALAGVSLTAQPGEALGIVGENGSGKSTLLRVVAGISPADAGTLEVAQPVSAILELGLGFHPDFSGRQNALLHGSLIGISEREMRDRLQEIIAFADIGEFIDQPVRTYSSGMSARLAFAVATSVAPRVLVVDEALAVGDGAFQRKCVERMVRFKEDGRTVLFCSHSMYLVAEFCGRAVWLQHGKVAAAGPTQEVVHAYEDYLRYRDRRQLPSATERAPAAPGVLARLEDVAISPAQRPVRPGEPIELRLRVARMAAGLPLHVAVSFEDDTGFCLAAFATHWDGLPPLSAPGDEEVVLHIPECPFTRGRMDVLVYIGDVSGLQIIDQVVLPGAVAIASERWEPGFVRIAHRWEGGFDRGASPS